MLEFERKDEMKATKLMMFAAAALSLVACGSNPTPASSGSAGSSASQGSTHTHTYSSEWSHDDVYHWHNPTCGDTTELKDKAEHTFDAWVIDKQATETEEGSQHKTCTVCGHTVTESIPKTEKEIEFGKVSLNVDSFEGDYHEYIVIGKTYLVVLTILDKEDNDITASDKIEYQVRIQDGTTNMTGDWADVTAGENVGEFKITPKSRGLDQHADLFVNYRKKTDKVWSSYRHPSTIGIYTAE